MFSENRFALFGIMLWHIAARGARSIVVRLGYDECDGNDAIENCREPTMRRALSQLLFMSLLIVGATFGHVGMAGAANVAILMPGSLGIFPGDFLVRNEERIKRAGIRAVTMTTSPASAAAAVAQEIARAARPSSSV